MGKKIILVLMVLMSSAMSSNAQTYKFLLNNNDVKNIYVYKQNKNADTLILVTKVAVPNVLTGSFSAEELANFLNENQNDTIAYEISQITREIIPSKYFILPPYIYNTVYYKGMKFSVKEMSFKKFEYKKSFPDFMFNADLKKGLLNLFFATLLLFIITLLSKYIMAMKLGIRTFHDYLLYLLLYLFMSIFFTIVANLTFFNIWIMIFFILPMVISAIIAHTLIEKKLGYRRVS